MKVDNPFVVCFDVDDTLIWASGDNKARIVIPLNNGHHVFLKPNHATINNLKYHAAQKHHIIVWSKAGADWAQKICLELGIDTLIDEYMTKPFVYYDDKDANTWMERVVPREPI